MGTYKVYRKGNYIIVEDSANKYWEEIALNTKVSKEFINSSNYTIAFKDVNVTWVMPFADIREEDGTTYADVATWESWYTANTGFISDTSSSLGQSTMAGSTSVTLASDQAGSQRIPTMFRSSLSTPAITIGKKSVSISNVGTANGTVLGAVLKPGETVNFDAGAVNNTLSAIAYDATGTEFLVIHLV